MSTENRDGSRPDGGDEEDDEELDITVSTHSLI
jgi:hypothetical protein